MTIPNLYRKIKQILEDSNVALENRGFNRVNSLGEIMTEIERHGEINCLPYFLKGEIIEVTENDLAGVTVLRDDTFRNCPSLTSVTIPDSVTSIKEDAFYGCSSLTSVTIGNGVTSIADKTFEYRRSLKSITIGNSVADIGNEAFSECDSLTSITIPDSVTSIGNWAFYSCDSLKSVTIGNGVTSIGDYAFYDCSGLIDIYLNSTTPPILGTSETIPTTSTIHVPIGSRDAYKSKTNWSYHSSRIVEDIEIN